MLAASVYAPRNIAPSGSVDLPLLLLCVSVDDKTIPGTRYLVNKTTGGEQVKTR